MSFGSLARGSIGQLDAFEIFKVARWRSLGLPVVYCQSHVFQSPSDFRVKNVLNISLLLV